MKMTEQQASYEISGNATVKAVRLENFRDPDWRRLLVMRLNSRYPACRVVSRQPYVAVIELRTSSTWSKADENFFAILKEEGFFQRWETLAELPPAPRHNQAIYEDIGYRCSSGERLTPAQQQALLSQLHDLELRALTAEQTAEEQRVRADQAVEHANQAATDWNALVEVLDQELSLKIYADGESFWMAEDATTGKILMRHKTLAEIYQTAIRRTHDGR
jgi:hypothetical protein